ncbi:biotin carboxyl carrier domain-containing protein [Streptomyces armeniacus]|uniref:Biotin carboxyl carrier protein of acetyl-CoA carboxylase n=1 Tax=Streptomyces armeniacus TaxID=83291 RepID=A0A345XS48_9ACTN|nr:acetyl-CoA carboxylase [Streptomyces armeniacus]AXK34464.1 biotin carboxyl carrier domain-containing protein [Streptomyces armeniacus]
MATIKATMPGVFYRRPSPEAEPYVKEGGGFAAGQTIALIEVMKTFNEVRADTSGTLVRFLLEDGDEVAMGQDIVEVDAA